MSVPAVAFENVHLTLGSEAGPVNILRGIDLEIPAGQAIAVVGPSGSGKSTFLMVAAGLERASSGRVTVFGQDLATMNEDRLAAFRGAGIGIVFQSFHLVQTMTALENVALPLELLDQPRPFDRAREALARVGLSHRLSHYPGQLSGGEQQRVALARAVVGAPRLLLADEPTGNLDGTTGAEIMDLIFSLRAEHEATLVLITHDTTLAARCDRVVSLADGRVADDQRRAARAAE